MRFNHFIDAVKYDVSRLTNLLWAGVLKFQVGALHKLFHELMYTLLLCLQVLFNVVYYVLVDSLRIITVAILGSFTISSYLLKERHLLGGMI